MFLLNLKYNNNHALITKLYKELVDYKLYNLTEIIFEPDYTAGAVDYSGVLCSFVLLNLKDFEDMDWMDIEDVFFNLIELGAPVVFNKAGLTDEKFSEIVDIANDTGLSYLESMDYDFDKAINLRELNDETFATILEIFEENQRYPLYSAKNFLFRWQIENNGDVTDSAGKVFGNLEKDSLIDIIFKKPSNYKTLKKHSELHEGETVFSVGFASILPFMTVDKDVNLKIDRFKQNVFESIKNIKPSEYANLDYKLIELLCTHEYIQLDDIVKIVGNNDDIYSVKSPLTN